jgi:hypothetical protein
MQTVYEEKGYTNRKAYLLSLCEEYPRHIVFTLAQTLGPNEDFDGLVTMLEDAEESGEFEDLD